jgi:putative peptide-modifying radical SAM enzyme
VDEDFSHFDVDYNLPREINYDLKTLDDFCKKDPDCVLTFYGGEPLLKLDKIVEIVQNVTARCFMMQTNGLLLDKLDTDVVNRFHTLLVSLDGDERLTDYYRGNGTYRKVVENLKLIKENGFRGELIARMTVMEKTDLFKQVRFLVENEELPFSSVHWQLNAGFWKNDFERREFGDWSKNSYNPDVQKLVRYWVDFMEDKCIVLKLYPLLGVTQSILTNEKPSSLRCGGGWINYAIQTDGYIIPCPTMWGIRDYYLGHLKLSDPQKLGKISVGEPCTSCDAFNLCGGRCLYAQVTKRWTPEAYSHVCDTVKNLLQAIQQQIPRIRELIQKGRLSMKDLEYTKYNGCEIIP